MGILGAALGTVTGPAADPPLILVGLASFNIAAVPEPSSLAVCALGLGAMMFFVRRKKN